MRLAIAVVLAMMASAGVARAEPQPPAARRVAHPGAARTAVFKPTAFSVEVHGRGRPVILIPGLGCPATVWRGTIDQLHGYQSHAITLAGFAGVPRIDRPLLETAVQQLARYIRVHHLVRPVIIGHSLGGSLALLLAARAPALVGPIVVVDAGAGDGASPDDDARAAEQARARWRDASDAQFAQMIKDTFSQMAVKPERLAPVIADVAKSDRGAIGDAVYELSTMPLADQLRKIRVPVLLVLADGSLQDDFRRQARAIPHHQVVVLPRTGHFVMIDDPGGFFAAVDDFLSGHGPVASRPSRPTACARAATGAVRC